MPGPWTNVAEAYARSFAGLCAGAVPLLLDAVTGRRQLLDVGSGTGLLAPEALRRGHHVTACDPEPDLLRLTAATAPGANVVRAALPDLPFPVACVDAVTACFVVNHLPDPRAGLAELHRVLRPGGVLAAAIWPPGATRQAELFQVVMGRGGATPPPSTRLDPVLDFDRSQDGFADLLESCGWHGVSTTTVRCDWRPTPDDY